MGQHFGSNDATSTTINIKAKKVMFLLRGCVCAQYCQQQNPGTSEGCLQIRQRAAVICHVCLINPAQRSSFFNPKEKKKKKICGKKASCSKSNGKQPMRYTGSCRNELRLQVPQLVSICPHGRWVMPVISVLHQKYLD